MRFEYQRKCISFQKCRAKYDLRKYSFTNRVVGIKESMVVGNSPDYVVLCDTINTFKARLHTFWQDQEVFYAFKKEILHGTGSQSCH